MIEAAVAVIAVVEVEFEILAQLAFESVTVVRESTVGFSKMEQGRLTSICSMDTPTAQLRRWDATGCCS